MGYKEENYRGHLITFGTYMNQYYGKRCVVAYIDNIVERSVVGEGGKADALKEAQKKIDIEIERNGVILC